MNPIQTAIQRRALLAWAGAAAIVPFQGCIDTFRGTEAGERAYIVLNNLTRERIAGELAVWNEDREEIHEEPFYIERGNHHQTAEFPGAPAAVRYEVVEATAEDPATKTGEVEIPDEPGEDIPDRDVRRITLEYSGDEGLTYLEF